MTKEELNKILDLHSEWLSDPITGIRADLSGADLSRANLYRANLSAYSIVPEEGPFYCYKKLSGGTVATLYVPRSAKRLSNLIGRKCRVSRVKVIALSNGNSRGVSQYDPMYGYEIGKWVTPDSFNGDIRIECTNGIHVFMTKQEAEDY